MRPITYTLSSTIPAPIDRVFAALTDPFRMALWLPAARAVEAAGPLGQGTRFRVLFDTRDTELEVVDFNPPTVFGWIERVGRRHWQTFFRLEFAGGSTRLTVQQIWTPPSPLAWLRAKLSPRRNVPGRLDMMVQNLRTTLAR